MVLRGWYLRTRNLYTRPLTIDCEVVLESGEPRTGAFYIRLVPPDSPKDLHPSRSVDLVFGSSTDETGNDHYSAAIEVHDSRRHANTVWREEPIVMKLGQPYQLRWELVGDHMRVSINDRSYVVKDTAVGYEHFYIQLRGWQPTNDWHVRNFVIR
jgi:hypothetical protein